MYEKVSSSLNFVEREKKIEKFWRENKIFEKSIEARKNGENYTFFDGPPTANGMPHIGHVETRVIKDMIPRYRTMKGYKVDRKAGWDTHGLPVEIEVEKKLGLDGKEQIEGYGMDSFIEECKKSVWKYKGMWEDFSGTVGFWADMDNPYVTYENNYIESEWWALKQIYDKGLLYKDFQIVPYCPRCGTPLATHEVAQGYKTVKERSAIVRFKAVGEDAYFLAWTTTPWTLPSNVALTVNPKDIYCKVKAADGYTYYMAKALLDTVLGKLKKEDAPAYEIIEEFPGKALEYREYEPLFPCTGEYVKELGAKAHFLTTADYVTMTDGTGIVHTAPAFGADDLKTGRRYELPFVQFVNKKGEMTEHTPYAGLFVKDADPVILKDLENSGKLFDAPKFEHEYPFCWRCEKPLIYYALDCWFIRMTQVRDRLLANNDTVNWIPENIGKGRFGDWLENVQDWGISRYRYWGTPLNIWECECGHTHSIGSIEELKALSDNCPDNIELHRPFIDEVTIKCPHCGKDMHRIKDVIDCWFDSGSMPFAQWHYPFENQDVFEKHFPADFISEATDQTRGWFYSLMAISTLIFDKSPYKNVIVLGLIQDENGQKMSKSKGNAVDPFDALEQYGADAIRWYFYSNSAPWLPKRFHGGAVIEGQRKFMGTLWNTYAFFVLYANIDGFDATKYHLEYDKLSVMDKWILSRLNTVVGTVDKNLENYEILQTTKVLQDFIDDLSNWYVRRSRERFWATGMEQDKINAYMTLYTSLVTLAEISAPMIPFMAEEIYRNLVCSIDKTAPESVHLCDFPAVNDAMIDKNLEESMNEVLEVVVLGRACRNSVGIKNKQPLSKMYIKAKLALEECFTEIIEDELNVKQVIYTDDVSAFTSYSFKPEKRALGKKYGKYLGKIGQMLAEADGNALMAELNENGIIKLDLGDITAEIAKEELLISTAQTVGYESLSDNGVTVILDTNLTPELIAEGNVREIVSKIQSMRKDAGFEVLDKIYVHVLASDAMKALIEKNASDMMTKLLCVEFKFESTCDSSKEWTIGDEKMTIGVEKV